ncbi:MAG: rod shape-determining protein MreC [Prolixibacteraceae bacterium]|nr:rod shape-determining protein MreC [Prolixibacteraceae bacterium]
MRNLLNFLYRYHAFILFLLLEFLCFTFIVRYSNFQRVRVLNSSNRVSGWIYKNYQSVEEFFALRRINDQLAADNANLRSSLLSLRETCDTLLFPASRDSNSLYSLIPAKVIHNSVNKQYNYITLNKGSNHGIKPDMGIVSPEGIVGVVINVSKNYATALSVLNSRWSVNAKLAKTNHFGPLYWEGVNPYVAVLNEIPYHVEVEPNDEVITSGFSTLFPEGILIGKVLRVEHEKGNNFQKIWVQLSTDFKGLSYVYLIDNKGKYERDDIENMISDE